MFNHMLCLCPSSVHAYKLSSFHQLNATHRYEPMSPKKVGSQETMIDMASLCKLKGSTMKG